MKIVLGKSDITENERHTGKTLNFASIYGAQAKKIALTINTTEEKAQEFLTKYFKAVPKVTAWIYRTIYEAKQKGGVFTLNRRFIPLPGLKSPSKWERMHWERVAVNAIIQGSAAEILKLSLIALKKMGVVPVLTVHDSFLIEIPGDAFAAKILGTHDKQILENVVKLDIPLKIKCGVGVTWAESKEG